MFVFVKRISEMSSQILSTSMVKQDLVIQQISL